ncbi:sugar phosphate isomerase/epimerase family protein [Gemmata sp.]|uniref:sugar phosphate isomerase/epimerase family protein n=1 Tax=Gemmata sp. TaxID=1914242 RepID=UPI003F71D6CB
MTMTRREFTALGLAAASGRATAAAEPPPAANLGLLLYSYGRRAAAEKDTGFADPVRFLEFAKARGAAAVQLPLGARPEADAKLVRAAADKLGTGVEGIVAPPRDGRADAERFAAELAAARTCGATVVRTVLSPGRRYEVFGTAGDYAAFAKRAAEVLRVAEPIARAEKVALAVENHKDFRTDELVALLKKLGSEWVGVCLDTGNNLALLEDPVGVAEALAPLTLTVHLKDIGLEDAADGFRMAEVPLGQGALDLKAVVAAVRKAAPRARFHLEMITRDPLAVPCLGEKYWATLAAVPGRDLAVALRLVRAHARKEPLQRVTQLKPDEQLAAEDRNVRASFAHAAKVGLVPG